MRKIETSLQDLKSQHPEWNPWLDVVQAILRETTNDKWDAVVPPCADAHQSKIPLLAQAQVNLPRSLLRPMISQLIRTASGSGSPAMATLAALAEVELDVVSLFKTALHQDREALKKSAVTFSVDSAAFEAVAAMFPLPLLHACNRRWEKSLMPGWTEGYCSVCGAWPAFAEVRGIERSRYFRCGRCGAGWQAQCLLCPFCAMNDHKQLMTLVPENHALNAVIEACKRCLGYVKTFTKLQGSPPAKVILDDLASVELDVAAAEQGYKRPHGAGYFLNVSVNENGAGPAL